MDSDRWDEKIKFRLIQVNTCSLTLLCMQTLSSSPLAYSRRLKEFDYLVVSKSVKGARGGEHLELPISEQCI